LLNQHDHQYGPEIKTKYMYLILECSLFQCVIKWSFLRHTQKKM
jgi:hypothetical protein